MPLLVEPGHLQLEVLEHLSVNLADHSIQIPLLLEPDVSLRPLVEEDHGLVLVLVEAGAIVGDRPPSAIGSVVLLLGL